MELIIYQAVFLELSGDDIVDPDAAIEQLEYISWSLQQLSEADRLTFIQFVNEEALKAEAAGSNEELVDFLKTFPEAFGLIDD
ncbi:MAG TPA: hypothetical protein VEF04_09875 [Blastocatellia bacterium]|nr:hypothetical protein [Blastocatellia bacterium]